MLYLVSNGLNNKLKQMAKSIKFKDDVYLDSTGIHRDIIKAYASGRPVLNITSWTATIIPLDKYLRIGKKLSLINNKVVIGKGVKKVLCSCLINSWNNTKTAKDGCIYHNGKNISFTAMYTMEGYQNQTAHTVANCLVEVNEGDTIDLRFNTGGDSGTITILGDGGVGCFLTVEVVE